MVSAKYLFVGMLCWSLFPASQGFAASYCGCIKAKTCLPPPQALIICQEGGKNVLYTRESVMSKDSRAEELLGKLRHRDPATRTTAATDLGVLGYRHQKVGLALMQAVQHDQSKWVRRAAVKALGKLRFSAAAQVLRAATFDSDQFVSQSASQVLKGFSGGDTADVQISMN